MEKFSQRIQRYRLRKKLSIRSVATTLGVSASTYRAWEYGAEIKGHRPYVILAELYDVSLNELIMGKAGEAGVHIEQIEKALMELKKVL